MAKNNMHIVYRYFHPAIGKFYHFNTLAEAVVWFVENKILDFHYDLIRSNFDKPECIPTLQVVVNAQVVGDINVNNLMNSNGHFVGSVCRDKQAGCGTFCKQPRCPEVKRG